jgi:oligopeptide transport system ATP-binding protein
VLDEPVSALDVSIQAQIINLLDDLKVRMNLSYVFISHDLSVVQHVSDRVLVMYLGRVVELGPAQQVLEAPLHPYTQALVSAVPEIDPAERKARIILAGDPPNPEHVPPGCAFHPRCPKAIGICAADMPIARSGATHSAACHLLDPSPPASQRA